jgi:hypothetical protein
VELPDKKLFKKKAAKESVAVTVENMSNEDAILHMTSGPDAKKDEYYILYLHYSQTKTKHFI